MQIKRNSSDDFQICPPNFFFPKLFFSEIIKVNQIFFRIAVFWSDKAIYSKIYLAQSAEAVEYTDCTSAEG